MWREFKWDKGNVLGLAVVSALTVALVLIAFLVSDVRSIAAQNKESIQTQANAFQAFCEAVRPKDEEVKERGKSLRDILAYLIALIPESSVGNHAPALSSEAVGVFSRDLGRLDLIPLINCKHLGKVLAEHPEHITADDLLGRRLKLKLSEIEKRGQRLDQEPGNRGNKSGVSEDSDHHKSSSSGATTTTITPATPPGGGGSGGGSGGRGGSGAGPGLPSPPVLPDPICDLSPNLCKSSWLRWILFP